MENILIAMVEIEFPDGKRQIKMILRESCDLEDCEEDKIIILNLFDGTNYTGVFKGVDDECVKLRALNNIATLAFELSWVKDYLEQL